MHIKGRGMTCSIINSMHRTCVSTLWPLHLKHGLDVYLINLASLRWLWNSPWPLFFS